ncbi:MAG: HPP family protein [Gammaproteobacteria bacterium]
MRQYFARMKGNQKCPPRKPLSSIAWSWVGSFLGILFITLCGRYLHFTDYDQLFLVGSFGASAVLIYGAPQVEYAQPRNLVGGHVISAIIGISVYKLIPDLMTVASALAVSLSIVAMHLTRTLHPPGGATALIAVIGSAQIHSLGYYYVLSPIGSGVIILLVIALIINNISSDTSRHYPVFWR